MQGLITRLRDACRDAAALCMLIRTYRDTGGDPRSLDELCASADEVEAQCRELMREIDAAEWN